MSNKQDGYASRTAADLERKYNFGQTFSEVYGLVSDARKIAEEAQSAFEGLNQDQIFNLLTNFGEAQGIYRDDTGNVYVNASYIQSGVLSGDKVKVAAAIVEGELSAATITADKISGGELDFNKVTAKNLIVGKADIEAALSASTITASQIEGGVLDFDLITARNMSVNAADVSGTLSSANISADNISGGSLDFDNVKAKNLQVSAANIYGDLTASRLRGSTIDLSISDYYTAGQLSLTGASSSSYAVELSSYGALRLEAGYGAAFMSSSYGAWFQLGSDVVLGGGHTRPGSNRSYSFGAPAYLWNDIYAYNTTILTSDLNEKKDLVYGLDKYDSFFDSLKPVSYLFKDGTSGRRHIGMISQDVEQALADNDLTSLEFAGFIKSPKEDENGNIIEGEYIYGLRYGEFISMCIAQIQNLKKRVKELEAKSA